MADRTWITVFFPNPLIFRYHLPLTDQRRWTWTGEFKCREVKTGFCRNRSMQTGSSGTLIGWKSGQTTFVPLWDWMEGAWLRTQVLLVLLCVIKFTLRQMSTHSFCAKHAIFRYFFVSFLLSFVSAENVRTSKRCYYYSSYSQIYFFVKSSLLNYHFVLCIFRVLMYFL